MINSTYQTIKGDTKANVGAAVGGIAVFAAWILKEFYGVTLTAEAAIGFSTAATWLIQLLVPATRDTSNA